jgi:hypothetical protein
LTVVAVTAVALTMLATAGAFACNNVATLTLSATSGPAEVRITATGTGYPTQLGIPVVLHWNGVDGPELGRVLPTAKGEFTLAFTIPATSPGYYVVVGVMRNGAGVDAYGTPSRASFQVLAPGEAPPPPPTTPQATLPPTTVPPTPGGLPVGAPDPFRPTPPTSGTALPTTTAAPTTTTAAPTTTTTKTTVVPGPATVAAKEVAATNPAGGDHLPGGAVAAAIVLVAAAGVALGTARLTRR